jgi:hypothetical protein
MMGVEIAQMADNGFSYDQWVADALRGVLRRALTETALNGLPGDHHFYINFRTSDQGVRIPQFLRAQYPNEITIVLQHQFEGLSLDEVGFNVTLSFSGKKHDLRVPFDAVISFADPSVNFGLQIEAETEDGAALEEDAGNASSPLKAIENGPGVDAPTPDNDEDGEAAEERPAASAEVITLDAFRKQ